jgi:hypothetical protein
MDANATSASALYDLLFCDDLSPFQSARSSDCEGALLLEEATTPSQVIALSQDAALESRVRLLAFHWLRANGETPPKKVVLGVVVEHPVGDSSDALAAYADGTVRYLNHAGGVILIEPNSLPEANKLAKRLVDLARPVVAHVEPKSGRHRQPPTPPNDRLTVLASDGVYVGEGPPEMMEKDDLGSAMIMEWATKLLVRVIDAAIEWQDS